MAKAKTRRGRDFGFNHLAGFLMSLPAMLLLGLFVFIPFIAAIWFSLHNINMNFPDRAPVWMGFEQYRRILLDPETRGIFYRSLLNNFEFALMVVPLQTIFAVLLALMLNVKLKGIAFFRTFYFMPVVFPMSLVTVMWSIMFSRDDLGLLNGILKFITFGRVGPLDWLGDVHLALPSIALMSMWAGVGFQMVIILAGLQEIPRELYEAAEIDRAGKLAQFWHVTVPGLKNTLNFVVIITTIFSLRLFDQVYILTGGGPQDSTSTVMYQAVTSAYKEGNVGKGAAYTIVFVLIIIVITVVQRRVLRENKEIA